MIHLYFASWGLLMRRLAMKNILVLLISYIAVRCNKYLEWFNLDELLCEYEHEKGRFFPVLQINKRLLDAFLLQCCIALRERWRNPAAWKPYQWRLIHRFLPDYVMIIV